MIGPIMVSVKQVLRRRPTQALDDAARGDGQAALGCHCSGVERKAKGTPDLVELCVRVGVPSQAELHFAVTVQEENLVEPTFRPDLHCS